MGNTTEPFALKKRDYCGTHHMYFEQRVGCGICNRIVQDAHERERKQSSNDTRIEPEVDIEDVVFPSSQPLTIERARIVRLRAVLREIVDMAAHNPTYMMGIVARHAQEALDCDDRQ